MRNLFARLWGKKGEEEHAPAPRMAGQGEAADKDGDLARTVERYRQQRAEERRQAKEAYTKQAEAQYGPATSWPRLSETLEGPTHPRFCQSCGAERPPEAPDEATGPEPGAAAVKANATLRLMKAALEPPPGVYGWQEHDGRDEPEPIAVMLCMRCSTRLIDPHPRVYSRIPRNAPFPGIMDLCLACQFRAGVTCTHPDRVASGGPGLRIDAAPAQPGHARGTGFFTLYAYPPRACSGRSVNVAEDGAVDMHTRIGEASPPDQKSEEGT